MRETLDTQISQAKSLLDVLLILKQKTMLDTHVATLAYLNTPERLFNGKFGIWNCKPFPLDQGQGEYQIQGYYFSEAGDGFKADAIVLVVFCDRNFISSLQAPEATPKETPDTLLHSLKYGVIVSLPGIDLTEEEKEELLDF